MSMKNMSTLCYIEKDGNYLMLHRTVKKNDVNKDKWIGVGGHFEEGESPEECVLREVKEETGYTLTSYEYRGLVTFLSGDGVTEYMSLFTADGFEGEPIPCDEGELEWVPAEKIWGLNIWEGDKIFFRLLSQRVPFFSLKLVYDGKGGLVHAGLNGHPMELLDVLNEDGSRSGLVRERGVVHCEGSLHPTVHIWIVKEQEDGRCELLLQKRSAQKDSYPRCYDISSAGHVESKEEIMDSALRELKEELGLVVGPEELKPIGIHKSRKQALFYGEVFKDYEWSYIFLLRKPVRIEELKLQESEVLEVIWMDYETCLRKLQDLSWPNCIQEEELQMVGKALGYSNHLSFRKL